MGSRYPNADSAWLPCFISAESALFCIVFFKTLTACQSEERILSVAKGSVSMTQAARSSE